MVPANLGSRHDVDVQEVSATDEASASHTVSCVPRQWGISLIRTSVGLHGLTMGVEHAVHVSGTELLAGQKMRPVGHEEGPATPPGQRNPAAHGRHVESLRLDTE